MVDITYLAVFLSCCGGYCLTRAKAGYMVICMLLYITASSIWIYYSFLNGIYSLALNAIIYIVIESFGLYKWYKQYKLECRPDNQIKIAEEIQREDRETLTLLLNNEIELPEKAELELVNRFNRGDE